MPFFEDQYFDLSQKGISLILGANKSASKTGNSNGAGKSYFFSQLVEMISTDSELFNRKDIIRKGSRTLEFRVNGKHYTVVNSFSPKEKMRIMEDGVDLQISILPDAKKKLESLIGYSSGEINTFLFQDSQMPHSLITGDTAIRKKFFKSFFKLGNLDELKKLVSSKISHLKEQTIRLEELRSSVREMKDSSLTDIPEARIRLDKMESRSKKLSLHVSSLQDAKLLQDRWQELKKFSPLPASSLEELDGLLEETKKEAKSAQKILNQWESYRSLKSAQSKSREEIDSIFQSTGELTIKEVEAQLESKRTRIKSLTAKIQQIEERSEELQDLISKTRRSILRAETDILPDLEKQRKHYKEASGKCPTCGAEHTNQEALKSLKIVKASIEEKSLALEKNKANLPNMEKELNSLESVDDLISKKKKIEKEIFQLDRLSELLASTASPLEKPTLSEKEANASLDAYHDLVEKISHGLREAISIRSRMRSPEMRELLSELDSLPELREKSQSTSEACIRLRIDIEQAEVAAERLKKARERIQSIKHELKDLEALQVLHEAFSRDGVQKILINTLCSELESRVNSYAKYLFTEDYTFGFELDSNFSITVTRSYGTRKETSDVRKLSGAEKKLFSIVLLISLMTFVPESRRSNLLILDEPTAAMGPENVTSFIKFLPVLNSVIPHIIVITPLESSDYIHVNPRVFTVVKTRKGVSTIKEGDHR